MKEEPLTQTTQCPTFLQLDALCLLGLLNECVQVRQSDTLSATRETCPVSGIATVVCRVQRDGFST